MILTEQIMTNFFAGAFLLAFLLIYQKIMDSIADLAIESASTSTITYNRPDKKYLSQIVKLLVICIGAITTFGILDVFVKLGISGVFLYSLTLFFIVLFLLLIEFEIALHITDPRIIGLSITLKLIFAAILGAISGNIANNLGITILQDTIIFGFFNLLYVYVPYKYVWKNFLVEKQETYYPESAKGLTRLKWLGYIALAALVYIAAVKGMIFQISGWFFFAYFGIWYIMRYSTTVSRFPPLNSLSTLVDIAFPPIFVMIFYYFTEALTLPYLLFLGTIWGFLYWKWNEMLLHDYASKLKEKFLSKYQRLYWGAAWGAILFNLFFGLAILIGPFVLQFSPELFKNLAQYNPYLPMIVFLVGILSFSFVATDALLRALGIYLSARKKIREDLLKFGNPNYKETIDTIFKK